METAFAIEGMSCQHCVAAVKAVLDKLPGVREARVEVGRAVLDSNFGDKKPIMLTVELA